MSKLKIELEGIFMEHVDPRRRQEKRDARMIREDHNKIANLPDKFIQREFNPWRDVERLEV